MSQAGAPSARALHTAVWTGTRMIVFGGNASGAVVNTGGIYDPVANAWAPLNTVGAPSPRSRHSAVWTGSKMIVFGGSNSPLQTSTNGAVLPTLNDGGIYDPATNTWQPLQTAGAPSVRRNHSAFWTGTKMIIQGGDQAENIPAGYRSDGGMYDPVTNTWQLLGMTAPPSARFYPSATWTGKTLLFFGGSNGTGGIFNDVWSLR